MLSGMTPMTFAERLASAWTTVVAAVLAYAYLLTYAQPNRNRMTKFIAEWSNRKYGRWSLEGPKQLLFLGILFSIIATGAAVLTILGKKS